MNSPPPAAAAGFSTLHHDIIDSHILSRLDGPSLAAVACCSTALRRHSSDHTLWLNICRSTWPSTASASLTQLISAFPGGGPRAFFSQASPLLSDLDLRRPPSPPPPELLSAVDIHYNGKLILTTLQTNNTAGNWFHSAPFRIDLFDTSGAPPAAAKSGGDGGRACAEFLKGMTLSWIIIDPAGRRAVNISSHEPVSVRRHWLTREVEVRFATVYGGESGHVKCGIVVTCWGGGEGEAVRVRGARVEVEDLDGKHLNGRESMVILQGAMEGKRGEGKNRNRYAEFEEMKRERREREERREGNWDTLCVAFGVFIFVFFCFCLL